MLSLSKDTQTAARELIQQIVCPSALLAPPTPPDQEPLAADAQDIHAAAASPSSNTAVKTTPLVVFHQSLSSNKGLESDHRS